MKQRILTGAIIIIACVPVFWFSYTYLLNAVAALVGLVATHEVIGACKAPRHPAFVIPVYLFSLAVPLAATFSKTTYLGAVCIYVLTLLIINIFTGKVCAFEKLCAVLTLSIYISMGLCSLIFLREVPSSGAFLFSLVFVCSIATDTFAYFVGNALGRHKLIPQISPKKTIEGSVGGLFGAFVFSMILGLLANFVFEMPTNFIMLAVASVVLSAVAQLGDLAASAVKRAYKIKDFGHILPGHGGFFDRLDSVIAVSIALAFITEIFSFYPIFYTIA